MVSSLASEDSLCRGRKEGSPQPSSWGLSDCGVKRYSHLRQLWQPGPLLSVTVETSGITAAPLLYAHCAPGPGPSTLLTVSSFCVPTALASALLQTRKRYGSNPLRVYSYEVQEQANQFMLREVRMLVTLGGGTDWEGHRGLPGGRKCSIF